MGHTSAVRRVLSLLTATVFLAHPLHGAASASLGASVLMESEADSLPYRGSKLGLTSHDSETLYKNDGTPFRCQVIDSVDILGAGHDIGIAAGDKLCSVNSTYFENRDAMYDFIGSYEPGTVAKLTFSRPSTQQSFQGRIALSEAKDLSVDWRLVRLSEITENHDACFCFRASGVAVAVFQSDGRGLQVYGAKVLGASGRTSLGTVIKVGDVIYSIDDKLFPDRATFDKYILSLPPGYQVHVEYISAADAKTYQGELTPLAIHPYAGPAPSVAQSLLSDSRVRRALTFGAGLIVVAGVVGFAAHDFQESTDNPSQSNDCKSLFRDSEGNIRPFC